MPLLPRLLALRRPGGCRWGGGGGRFGPPQEASGVEHQREAPPRAPAQTQEAAAGEGGRLAPKRVRVQGDVFGVGAVRPVQPRDPARCVGEGIGRGCGRLGLKSVGAVGAGAWGQPLPLSSPPALAFPCSHSLRSLRSLRLPAFSPVCRPCLLWATWFAGMSCVCLRCWCGPWPCCLAHFRAPSHLLCPTPPHPPPPHATTRRWPCATSASQQHPSRPCA
jgi:hypothetical protein